MLLHSAASMHGHEFSTNNPTPRRTTLVRSAFSTSSSRSSASYENTPPANTRSTPRLSAGPRRNNERVSFVEPEMDATNEDALSYASEGSETTAGGTKRRRKSTRTSTQYHFAHPAPTLTRQQKLLQIRPKLLLQIQRLSSDKRPLPTIDVMPSMVVVPRLMKKFPRMFKGKGALGTNDVLIVKSEDYNTSNDNSDEDLHEDDSVGNRDVLAVICQTRGSPKQTEICLSDGSKWNATSHLKNSFEFETTDPVTGEVTKARWVQRIAPRRQEIPGQLTTIMGTSNEPKYSFSILDPNSRRHPILASLTKDRLDIPDTYTTCSSSAGRHPPTSPIRLSNAEPPSYVDEEGPAERTTHSLDDTTRVLIQVTSIWIALNKGWSPYFSYNECSPGSTGKTAGPSGHRARSASVDHKQPVVDTRASTPESGHSFTTKGGKIFRPGSSIFGRSPSGISPAAFEQDAPLPKRSVSTGTAFMARAAARKTGQPPSIVASDSEGEMSLSTPVRAATMDFGDLPVQSKRMSTPSPLAVLGFSGTTPETPTKPNRRVQSAIYPSNPLKSPATGTNGQSNGGPPRIYHNNAEPNPVSSTHYGGGEKRGKWKTLLGFFRRNYKSEN
jgi:hypothetical protein